MPDISNLPKDEKMANTPIQDKHLIITSEILPSAPLTSHTIALAERTLTAIIEQPGRELVLVEAFRSIVNPDAARAEGERRKQVLMIKLGTGISMVSIAGTIVVSVINGPLVIAVGLLCIAAASAGAAFVIASGNKIKASEFREMLSVLSKNNSSGGSNL